MSLRVQFLFYAHTRLNTWRLFRTAYVIGWRYTVQHTDVLTHSQTILATYGWGKRDDEKAGVGYSMMVNEWEDITNYAKCYMYLNLVQENYALSFVETLQCCWCQQVVKYPNTCWVAVLSTTNKWQVGEAIFATQVNQVWQAILPWRRLTRSIIENHCGRTTSV